MRESSMSCPQNRQDTRARRPAAVSLEVPESIEAYYGPWDLEEVVGVEGRALDRDPQR